MIKKNVALLFRVSFNSQSFLFSFCEWPQSEALQATPVWHCHSHSACGNSGSWINVRIRMFFCGFSSVAIIYLLNCDTEDDDLPAPKEKSFLCSFNQPHLKQRFFFFCRLEVIFATYCLFSMNFNFLEKKTKKTNCPQIANLKKHLPPSDVSTYSVASFQGWMFELQWKSLQHCTISSWSFWERKHHLCSNTVSYWVVWITSQQHLQWNQKPGKHKMNKYLKWIKKDVILQFWELVYYKWMNICCLARSPSPPPLSPLQATRQQHSAGRSKLNTRPRGGALLPFDL